MKEKIEEALKKIRPALEADGGGIELVDVVDGVVKVRLQGACQGCMINVATQMSSAIEGSNDIYICENCGKFLVTSKDKKK